MVMAAAGEGHNICLSEKVFPAGVLSSSGQMLHVMQHLQRDELFIGTQFSLFIGTQFRILYTSDQMLHVVSKHLRYMCASRDEAASRGMEEGEREGKEGGRRGEKGVKALFSYN